MLSLGQFSKTHMPSDPHTFSTTACSSYPAGRRLATAVNRIIIDMNLEQGLVNGRGKKQSKEVKRRFDECEQKVRSLRSKNNQLQKQCENELDSDIRQAVKEQGYYLEKEIGEIKTLISKLSADYTDPPSKARIKDLLNLAGKEVERNKRIMEDFVNRASSSPSFLKSSPHDRVSKTEMEKQKSANRDSTSGKYQEGVSLVESDQIQGDLVMERRIMAEKAALLREIEEKNNKINQLYNEMGEMVGGEQHDQIQQLDANNTTARDNLLHANEELDQAIVEQRKAKKKYIFLTVCIIIVLIVAAGIIYLFIK